jgi:hypothetical protein
LGPAFCGRETTHHASPTLPRPASNTSIHTEPRQKSTKNKIKYTQNTQNTKQETRDAADRLLDKGEALLKEWRHPDPLVPPYWVGGTAFSRNPPMSESVKISLDFGREDGH